MPQINPKIILLKVGIILTFGLIAITGYSQSRSFATLPILIPDSTYHHNESNLNDTPEYRHLQTIYRKLVNARGDFRYPVPALYLRDEEGYVASIDYNELSIIIEKKAYEVCKPFGDTALAFLLAHELTHYYEKHAWKSDFVYNLNGLDVVQNLKDVQDQVMNETQADYLGGFLAYSAGFGLFDKGGAVIDSLYKAYKRPEKIQGYPSKTDRIKMADKSAEKIKQLAEIFNFANYMTAVGRYSSAFESYRHLLIQYQSCEIYNNAGTAAVLDALSYFNEDSLKYKYVTELDIDFKGSRSAVSAQDSILKQAIQYFDAAVSMDPDYAPGYLNKANAYALLNDVVKAKFYVENEAEPALIRSKGKYPKTESDVFVLKGILEARSGNKTKAMEYFDTASKQNNEAAIFNKNVVAGLPNPKPSGAKKYQFLNDSIGSMTLNQYFNNPTHIKSKEIGFSKNTSLRQSGGKKDYKIYNYTSGKNVKTRSVFLEMMDSFAGKTKQSIAAGSTVEQVKSAYGVPDQIISSVQGSIYLYNGSKSENGNPLDENKILIIIDDKNLVKKWLYFSTRIVTN